MPTTLEQDAYNKQRDALVSSITDKYNKSHNDLLKMDLSKVNTTQLDNIAETLHSVLNSNADIATINQVWESYNAELNKVIWTIDELGAAAKRTADEQTAAAQQAADKQAALDKKWSEFKDTRQKTQDLKAAFEQRQAEI